MGHSKELTFQPQRVQFNPQLFLVSRQNQLFQSVASHLAWVGVNKYLGSCDTERGLDTQAEL